VIFHYSVADRSLIIPFEEYTMSVNEFPKNPVVGFFTSLPGILTSIGALITAVGGIYLGVVHSDSSHEPSSQPVVNLTVRSGNTPDPSQVSGGSLRLANLPAGANDLPDAGSNDPFDQLINSCAEGDDGACLTIVDALVNDCAQGYGLSCDVLYEISPSYSDLEAFGGTCGDRFDPTVADTCRYQ
jgi:hypothetical protein